MKIIIKPLVTVILGAVLLVVGCSKNPATTVQPHKHSDVSRQLRNFVAEKEAQESVLVAADKKDYGDKFKPTDCQPFFDAAVKNDWQTASNLYSEIHEQLENRATAVELHGKWWPSVMETYGAMEQFTPGNEKYAAAFGSDIIDSIPAGSVYFGGTDPGRFIVTALQKSHVDGDPFFTLTQNALADGTYLDYLRSMYGSKIYIPTSDDSQKSFQDYTEDVTRRQQNNQLKPGEIVQVDKNSDRVQVSGQVAVMSINGLLVKIIFDKNPEREFYIEESFPLDWMYPNLEPHGLIMKINRQPLPALSDEIVKQDRDYWAKYLAPMIGDWLNPDTTVQEVADFAEKVYAKNDLSGFNGDPQFIQSSDAQKMFSKLRSSQAGLYAWRAQHAKDAGERKRMNTEADFAFRQALALCPYSPEAVYRYVNLLLPEGRVADALLVAETAGKMPAMQGPDGEQVRGLITQLKQFQKRK